MLLQMRQFEMLKFVLLRKSPNKCLVAASRVQSKRLIRVSKLHWEDMALKARCLKQINGIGSILLVKCSGSTSYEDACNALSF